MSTGKVNPDLSKERKSATFDSEKLTEVLYGGKQAVRRRRYLQNIVLQDKYLQSFKPWWNRTRVEDYDTSVKKSVYVTKLLQDLNITDILEQNTVKEAAFPHEADALGLHFSMFIPTIEKQGTKEQKKKYLEPARKFQLIGTYAQTEIGHGTFIRGLETTATYNPKTEEFVIHSPTLTSTKYWPGSLGKTSTHVVLMAQLYTGGKCYGMHSFVVQIRSLKDHSPLPGITVGDIGNKLAYSSMDNGFLRFDHVRVPRDAMLMRYAKVERDGTYKPPTNTKVTYGSMVLIRASIVGYTARCLAKSCVITTRYSAVRRQTEIRPGGEEPQVLDYQTQQEKLFPLIASAYAFYVTGNIMMMEYFRISQNIEEGNMEEMQVLYGAAGAPNNGFLVFLSPVQPLHGLASGLKALSSDVASHGIDVLRKACGGHGYTHASGIPKIWGFITPACTYEGENTVMYLQCGRYLVKCYEMLTSGKALPDAMQYLNKPTKSSSSLNDQLELSDLIDVYEHTAARLVKVAAERVGSLIRSGTDQQDARNQSGVLLVNAAMAHSRAFAVKTFAEFAEYGISDQEVSKVILTLCKLFAVSGIITNMGDFLQDGFISGQQAEMLINKQLDLFAELRPNAVALVDAFDYPDHILQSCLGRYDGNVYEALYEYAKGSPLNESDVLDSYHSTLRPLMKGELFGNQAISKL